MRPPGTQQCRVVKGRQSQAGFSLLELAMALVILGLVAVLLIDFLGVANQERSDVGRTDLLRRADDALLAFAMVNSRLPCPAAGGSGLEDCSGGQVGRLPYRTLGLPDANARKIRYGVLRRRDSSFSPDDADLTLKLDRYLPVRVMDGKSATQIPLFNTNGIDLCWALRGAQSATVAPAFLHVTLPHAPSQAAAHVAYALALPASGEQFSGNQAGNAAAFDSPRRRASAGYRDHVLAVGLDQMSARMRCGDHLAATGHAHVTAAATIAVMHGALKDYKTQLDIAEDRAEAADLSAGAGVAMAAAGLLTSGAELSNTIAESLATLGLLSPRVALATALVAGGIAMVVTASLATGHANTARQRAKSLNSRADTYVSDASTLKDLVQASAAAADASGMY